MNRQELDILLTLSAEAYSSQRYLAELTGYSLGMVNQTVKNLIKNGYLNEDMGFTDLSKNMFMTKRPRNAIILAAGFGMRMVPINMDTPKALLEVKGEKIIERLIKQLKETGISEIYVVVGFMKESFEYLIDEYGVRLIVNSEYTKKNNLYSLNLASKYISDTYILPCDLWCAENPFRHYELYSWYMVSNQPDEESDVRVNRKRELVRRQADEPGNAMVGIAYILKEDAEEIQRRIRKLCNDRKHDDSFWEEALYQKGKMTVFPRIVSSHNITEINTYEQLRELDSSSGQLRSDVISVAAKVFQVNENEITGITVLKKGMTNRSFSFYCNKKKYIMRIPGEGTGRLINRKEEAEVYEKIKGQNICDKIIYINPENGYKISEYIEAARVCDPYTENDISKCMVKLRSFHDMGFVTAHEFNIWRQIEFYESLWGGEESSYKDYIQTKKNVLSLRAFIEKYVEHKVLTHIDAVPDNFLFTTDKEGKEIIIMIDWEYAGMQDPHMDIAMFCIYSFYDRRQVDHLIDLYFIEGCKRGIRVKIYCYIAVCGLLWSNWCEYKRELGVEFGEYSLRQYRYAKEYYRIAKEEISKMEEQGIE